MVSDEPAPARSPRGGRAAPSFPIFPMGLPKGFLLVHSRMDNSAFELHGERIPSVPEGKGRLKEEAKKGIGSLMKLFLVCFLACILTTTIGILTLALIYGNNGAFRKEPDLGNGDPSPSVTTGKTSPSQFQFLYHLRNSKVHSYPGGDIQWARFRKDPSEYSNEEELEFGNSLHRHRSQMIFGILRIKSKGLRVPHWHFNANEHGYLLQGSAWVGILGADGAGATTYNVSRGQVVFFPRNSVHWIRNVGRNDCVFLLFYGTHEELHTLDMDEAFFSTPEDVAARALKPPGGVEFLRTFKKPMGKQAVNLPSNIRELLLNATYIQSPTDLVWRYFYDLQGSMEHPFPGGSFRWARYRKDGAGLKDTEKIFSESINKHQDTLTLATLRISSNSLGQPHFHFNGNELGYVISGCGQAGVILSGSAISFNVAIGDVVFFPVGSQHYLQSVCREDLLLLLAYNTGNQLETLRMSTYIRGTPDHILAQLFLKSQEEVKKLSGMS